MRKYLISIIFIYYLISTNFEVVAQPQDMVETNISLTLTIPEDEIDGVLNTYVLDGSHRILEYNDDEDKFDDVFFQIRTESELNVQPNNYVIKQMGNLLTCYDGELVYIQNMTLSVEGKQLIDNQIKLSGSSLWYVGSNKYYSDVLLKMVSPRIEKSNNKKWCTGSVSIIVVRDLVS